MDIMDSLLNKSNPIQQGCNDHDVMLLLRQFATNRSDSRWSSLTGTINSSCMELNGSFDEFHGINHHDYQLLVHETGKDVYAYMIPVIFVVGILGNGISLKVFTSKVMRRLSSSLYLVALSISDISVLLTYVLFDWLNHGLRRWPGGYRLALINHDGVCQVFLYVSYLFRIISAWVIVIFAVERYLAVCWPLQRKRYCTRSLAGKLIASVVTFSAVVCLYKPILSEVTHTKEKICTRNSKYHQLNFVLDSIYGLIITAIPSLVIMFLNMPILRRLISWDKARTKSRLVLKENRIRLEFTIIMLAISSCFIGLNLPYFVIWCRQFQQSLNPGSPTLADRISGELYITKMIFCINYCINFFMYCLTGAYYRREIKSMFKYYFRRKSGEVNRNDVQLQQEQCLSNESSSSPVCFCGVKTQILQ